MCLPMDSLTKLLYDPVGYYRPWRKAVARLTPAQRAAFNHYLLEHYALPDQSEATSSQKRLTDRVVSHWDVLPLAAYLVACAKWRSPLISSRVYLRESPAVRAFMQLGFHEEVLPQGAGAGFVDTVFDHGGRYVTQGLRNRLPAWLSARLPLVFKANHDSPGLTDLAYGERFDTTCFWSALTYATNHRELGGSLRY